MEAKALQAKYDRIIFDAVNIYWTDVLDESKAALTSANRLVNDILMRHAATYEKLNYCEICGLHEVPLSVHHVAGRKHDKDRLITVCDRCHNTLSDWQKDWPFWTLNDQPENMKAYYLAYGLMDILNLKSRVTGNSAYASYARRMRKTKMRLLNDRRV